MSGKFKWDKKYVYWGITAFLVVIGSVAFYFILSKLAGAGETISKIAKSLAPFAYGLLFAYLLIKLLNFFESAFLLKLGARVYRKNARKAATFARICGIILSLFCLIVIVGGMLWLILPQIYSSLRGLVMDLPSYYKQVVEWINKFLEDNPTLEKSALGMFDTVSERVTSWLQTSVLPRTEQIVSNITSGVISVVREVLYILIGIVISVYVMYHKETFAAQVKKITYSIFKTKTANRIIEGVRFVDKTCGGFIIGKIIDSVIIGIICY
ncbi:MAG: AI-2E family transporter, partial [Oscillospiraceae bacterium]|nr:AI-2E family transporter [Oscillospiraceae bacterium]